MDGQFLSLKKTKNRALADADQQIDELLDVREFFDCGLDEDEHFEETFDIKTGKKNTKGTAKGQKGYQPKNDDKRKV